MARNNLFASHQNIYGEYRRIRDVDALLLELLTDVHDPEDPLAMTLAFRAHSALRAGAQLMLSGQLPEGYAVLRAALEFALYAHHASTSVDRAKVWLQRETDAESKKRNKKEYTARNVFDSLRGASPDVGSVAHGLYERCIELGAHPNSFGVAVLTTMSETESEIVFDHSYIVGDGLPLRLGLKTWSQVAISVIDILALALPDRCRQLMTVAKSSPMRDGL